MRWDADPDPVKPRYGDVRYVKIFALWPYKTLGKWYWLETIVVRQVWSLKRVVVCGYVDLTPGWKDEAVVE